MRRLARNLLDLASVALVLAGAYAIHVGLLMMLVGVAGLLLMWQSDKDNEE